MHIVHCCPTSYPTNLSSYIVPCSTQPVLTLCHVAQLAQVPLLESIWCWLYAKSRHQGGSQTRGRPYYTSGYNLSTFVFVFVSLSEFVFAFLKVVFVFAPLGEQWADTKVVLRPLLHIRIWDVRVKTKINFFLCNIPSIWLCQIKLSSQTHFLSNVMSLKSQSVEKVSIVFFGGSEMLLLNISTSLLVARQTTLTGFGWNLFDSRKLFLSSVSAAQTQTFGLCWRRSIQPFGLIGSCRALFIPASPAQPLQGLPSLLYCVKPSVYCTAYCVLYLWTLSSNIVVGAV